LVRPKLGEANEKPQHGDDILAWGLSFPASNIEGGKVEYVVNTVRMREMFGEEEIEEEALDDSE
jgi:hypothetical protein